MAWTTPRCWTTGEVVTAALLNAQIKGNMDLTAPAKLTTAGDMLYATGANATARLAKGTNGNILHQASCAPAWTATPSITDLTLSGALDVNGTIDYDGTDVDMLSSGDIDLVSSANAAAAVYIAQSTGTSGTIKIHADTGTSVTEGAESVNILSDVGGVGIRSTANLAKAINLTSDGGSTGSIAIFNDQGTSVTEGAESISLLSDAGGVGIRSTANLANAINITNDGGTTGTISIFNDQGSSVTEGAESISLLSDAGGVGIRSTANLANAVNITADGGTTSTIQIFNDQGTAVNEGVASIQLLSDVGGIGIKSGLNAAGAIRLTADAGTSETIILHADQGSGAASICLTSDAGGITLTPNSAVTVSGALTVGVDDTGHDVQFFGAAAGAYLLYDQSCNLLDIRGATAAGPGHLKLTTGETTVVACDVLGRIDFQAPLEADCSADARLVAATIAAVAQGTFSDTVNATDLIFSTGHSETAAERIRITSQNEIGIAGANYGTDGQVLTSGGAGAAVAWEDAAGGGSLILIDTEEASDDAEIVLTGLSSTYDTYLIAISDLLPATDGDDLQLRVGDSSGVDSGSTDYSYHIMTVDDSSTSYASRVHAGLSRIILTNGVGSATGEGVGAALWLHRPGDGTTQPLISGTVSSLTTGGIVRGGTLTARRTAVITLDRVQVHFSSGNITSGRVSVWGLKHA